MTAGWRNFVVVCFALIVGLWFFSHLQPERFGECKQVPLNVGTTASIEECHAYGTADFIAPIAVVVLLVLLSGGSDFEFTVPGFGTLKRTRQGRQAAEALKKESDSIGERGEKLLETLPTPQQEQRSERPNRQNSPQEDSSGHNEK